LAYVLCQPFPTFALIGPRLLHETASSMQSLQIHLSEAEIAYLELRQAHL
jgi:aryl-alcohol dehydrogenase-like predicted oxidoreductase